MPKRPEKLPYPRKRKFKSSSLLMLTIQPKDASSVSLDKKDEPRCSEHAKIFATPATETQKARPTSDRGSQPPLLMHTTYKDKPEEPLFFPPKNTTPVKESNLKGIIVQTRGTDATPIKVTAVVAFYIIISITTIIINKSVLNHSGLPLHFLWGQLVVAVVILRAASAVQIFKPPPVSWAILKALAPLIAINVIGLVLNTLCLKNIDAVLYQVARSLVLPMTVGMSPILQKQKLRNDVIFCCTIITLGFLIGIFGERQIKVSTEGLVFGILSSFSTALHSFIIKNSFKSVKHNGAFDLVYYNNFFSAIFLLPFLLFEFREIAKFGQRNGWHSVRLFLLGTLLAGVSGFLINLAGFLQIRLTSPITHTVSSAARGVLQTLTAYFLLGEAITVARCAGIAVTLFGSCLYSLVSSRNLEGPKYQEIFKQKTTA